MNLRILGCSGGVAPLKHTTSFLINNDTLIDAGTGIQILSLDEASSIRRVFLTHSHLDHICHLPFLLNNILPQNLEPVDVYGLEHTINALKNHVFNNVIWPDFTRIPTAKNPVVRLHIIEANQRYDFDGVSIVPIDVAHAVPALGYWVGQNSTTGAFAFTGDSSSNESFWSALNRLPPVEQLIIDNQYTESEQRISQLAKHYTPLALKQDLTKLNYQPSLYITHLPPFNPEPVFAECEQYLADWDVKQLKMNQTYFFTAHSHEHINQI